MASMSRWLVGSSRMSRSHSVADERAGQRHPLGLPARQRRGVGVERARPCPSRSSTASASHRRRPPAGRPRPARAGRERRVLVEHGDRARRGPGSHRARLGLGGARPAPAAASTCRVPLSPTMPRRSPVDTVTERSANSGLPGRRLADTRSQSTRITPGRLDAGPRRGADWPDSSRDRVRRPVDCSRGPMHRATDSDGRPPARCTISARPAGTTHPEQSTGSTRSTACTSSASSASTGGRPRLRAASPTRSSRPRAARRTSSPTAPAWLGLRVRPRGRRRHAIGCPRRPAHPRGRHRPVRAAGPDRPRASPCGRPAFKQLRFMAFTGAARRRLRRHARGAPLRRATSVVVGRPTPSPSRWRLVAGRGRRHDLSRAGGIGIWPANGVAIVLLAWSAADVAAGATHLAAQHARRPSPSGASRSSRSASSASSRRRRRCRVALARHRRRVHRDARRRAGLVAQLRFAVTLQDIRTVVLLRRQLSQETPRNRPWIPMKRGGRLPPIWRRDWQSYFRFPLVRARPDGRPGGRSPASRSALTWQGATPAVHRRRPRPLHRRLRRGRAARPGGRPPVPLGRHPRRPRQDAALPPARRRSWSWSCCA